MSILSTKKKVATQSAAEHNTDASSNTFEGEVVRISGNKLVMTSKTGKEYSHTLAKNASITCNGTDYKAEDLKPGSKIRVTTKKDDRNVVTNIESLDKKDELAKCST